MPFLLKRGFIKTGNLSISSVTSRFSMNKAHHEDSWLFKKISIFFSWFDCRSGLRSPLYRGVTITHRPIHTLARAPLDEWSARHRYFYLATHTTFTTGRHPCSRRDSSSQSQPASGRSPMSCERATSGIGKSIYQFGIKYRKNRA
jgi:hypothetical protein